MRAASLNGSIVPGILVVSWSFLPAAVATDVVDASPA